MHSVFLPTALIVIFIAGFFGARVFLKDSEVSPQTVVKEIQKIIVEKKESCDEECKKIIKEEVAKAVSTIPVQSAVPKITFSPQPTTKFLNQTAYISLDGPYTTTSTSWVDVPGVEVTFDLKNEYGSSAKTSWESSLKVAHGNGQAFARLFDSTNGIAVLGSEISTVDNRDFKNVSSGNLNLWSGRNTYKVQVKSLNSFEVTYTSGKMKISY